MNIKKLLVLIGMLLLAFCISSCNDTKPSHQNPDLKPNSPSDFEYQINSDQSGVMIKKYIGKGKDVVIPSHIENLPVLYLVGVSDEQYSTAVKEGVFQGSDIKSVVIPETVTSIGYSSFAECSELTAVTFLPNSELTYVSWYAFWKCEKLDKIDFSETKLQRIDTQAFQGCTALTEIRFSNKLEYIGERAFYECSSLLELDFPQSLTEIDSGAFGYCTSVRRIVIPENVNLLFTQESAFHDISSFVEIEFKEGREEITGYALLQTPANVRIILPKSVKKFSPLPFLITPTADVEIVFYGDAPEIVEEKNPDWFGNPTIYYDAATNGWDTFEWKDKFGMHPHSQK